MSKPSYEVPAMVKVGQFRKLTNATSQGYWIDFFGGWWF